MKNTKNEFKSPFTNKEIDPAETLLQIQKMLREVNYGAEDSTGGSLTSQIFERLAIFNLLVDGICYKYEETDSQMDESDITALFHGWWQLKQLIDKREEEHHIIWNLALHGEEHPARD